MMHIYHKFITSWSVDDGTSARLGATCPPFASRIIRCAGTLGKGGVEALDRIHCHAIRREKMFLGGRLGSTAGRYQRSSFLVLDSENIDEVINARARRAVRR